MHAIQAKLGSDAHRADRYAFREWRTMAYVDKPSAKLEEKHRARLRGGAEFARMRTRRQNPGSTDHLHVPAETVLLGQVLDLYTQLDETRWFWDVELHSRHMLTDPDAMDMKPGRAGLYLVRGKLGRDAGEPNTTSVETYERWHERAARDHRELATPNFCGVYIGVALQIGYRSDKWGKRGANHDYNHDFCENGHVPPEVWADHDDLARARAVVIRGGTMRITEAGID